MERESSYDVVCTIVEAVADRETVSPLELPPLGDQIDCDALISLVTPKEDRRSNEVDRITLRYCGYDVTVGPNEQVIVTARKQRMSR